jgi:hypothetical protein
MRHVLRARAEMEDGKKLRAKVDSQPQSDVCCGFGGATSIEHGEVSERSMNNKLNNTVRTGAKVLVPDAFNGWGGREWEKDAGVAFGAAYSGEDGIAWEENVMPAFSA